MPRNRADIGRDEKVEEILAAARAQLERDGYAGLSVSGVARDLGLAQNAVYWYFPTKDHLLVATVERVLHDVLARKPRYTDPIPQIVWFADQLAAFQELRLAVRERARHAEVAAQFDRDVTALLRTLLHGSLSPTVEPTELDRTVDAVLALCEGVLLGGHSTTRRRAILRTAVPRLLS